MASTVKIRASLVSYLKRYTNTPAHSIRKCACNFVSVVPALRPASLHILPSAPILCFDHLQHLHQYGKPIKHPPSDWRSLFAPTWNITRRSWSELVQHGSEMLAGSCTAKYGPRCAIIGNTICTQRHRHLVVMRRAVMESEHALS